MGYKSMEDVLGPFIDANVKEDREHRSTKEQARISYGFHAAYDAMIAVAGEAFMAGYDNVAFYLRAEAEKLMERANEPWGN